MASCEWIEMSWNNPQEKTRECVKWRKWSSRQYFYFAETSQKVSSGFPLILFTESHAFRYLILNKGLFLFFLFLFPFLLGKIQIFSRRNFCDNHCVPWIVSPSPRHHTCSHLICKCQWEHGRKVHNRMISLLIVDNRSSMNSPWLGDISWMAIL